MEFKTAIQNYEENEKCCDQNEKDNDMFTKQKERFEGKCFKCGKIGHKSSECWMKKDKWCSKCKNKTHNTKDCRSTKKDYAKKATEKKKEDEENGEHSYAFTLNDSQDRRRSKESTNLLVDTGATSHIINDSSKFVSFDKNFDCNSHFIELADGSKANVVLGKGNAKVKLFDIKGNLHDIILNNALYIPSYDQNIFSVSAEIDKGGTVNLDKQASNYITEEGSVFEIKQKGQLYYLNSISSSSNNATSLKDWHKLLGHCNYTDIRKLEKVVDGMKITDYTR